MGNVKDLIIGVKDASVEGWNSIKTISDFLFYVMHPGMILQALWKYTVIYSYWVCLLVALLSIIFYVLGNKKAAKFIPGSFAIYALIKAISVAI